MDRGEPLPDYSWPGKLLQRHGLALRYRPAPFPSDWHRVEYLFALYEQLTTPLVAAAKPARKGRKTQTTA